MSDLSRLSTYKMYTIGWIAGLDKELTAALAMLDETHQQPEDFEQNDKDSNTYSWGRIGDHNIVIVSLGGGIYGLVSAATTATCMANSLPHLRFGLMVGIGAGVPNLEEDDIRLGDVVVSLPKNGHPGVIQYDLGKMRMNDFQRVGALAPPPTVLLKALDKLRAAQRLKGSKLPHILSQTIQNYPMLARPKGKDPAFIYQGAENDRLFEPTSVHNAGVNASQIISGGTKRQKLSHTQSCTHCDAEQEIQRDPRPSEDPEIHYGNIASGNLVIKDGNSRDQISQRLGTNVLCYEMEAAGLMNNFPCLVIRGICDYADSHKNDRWQNYASLVAAAYTKEFLGAIDSRSVEGAKRLNDIMASVSRDVSRIDSTTKGIDRGIRRLADSQVAWEISRWLSAPNPSGNHNDAFGQHHANTGKWFLRSGAYRWWQERPASSLWLYGMPGCGKTVLSSIIINDLKGKATDNHHLLFFYFSFSDLRKQSLDGAIRSLIDQLSSTNGAARECLNKAFYSDYRGRSTQPSTEWLCEMFETMIKCSGDIWIVLDALDEWNAGNSFADKGLLMWLKRLLSHKHDNLRILVTSRREQKVQMILDICIRDQICLQSQMVDDDIRTFIDATVKSSPALNVWQSHKGALERIKEYLMKHAHGMFRWVSCQLRALESLAGCNNLRVLEATLNSLPATLDETYARILKSIPSPFHERTQRILQFLIYSETPLRVVEAVEVTLIDPEAERSKRRTEPPNGPELNLISVYCPNLIKFVTENEIYGEYKVAQLSHFSVKEYLVSKRSEEQISWTFEESFAKASMAEICLASLLEVESLDNINYSSPLALRAAEFWVHYARQAGDKMRLGLINEFIVDINCQKKYFQLRFPEDVKREKALRYEKHEHSDDVPLEVYRLERHRKAFGWIPLSDRHTPSEPLLNHFARHGVLCGVKEILHMNMGSINILWGTFDTALTNAASMGHRGIVEELLHWKANVHAEIGQYTLEHALTAAVENSHEETVKILLEHGADVEATCGFGFLNKAMLYHNTKIISTKVINMLLGANTPVSQYAFDLACVNGETALLSIVFTKIPSADIAAYCSKALSSTCAAGQFDMVRTLISHNADINARDGHGFNSLYHAANKRNVEMVEFLLEKGATLNQESSYSLDPLRVARFDVRVMRPLLMKEPNAQFFDEALCEASFHGWAGSVKILLETFKSRYAIGTKRVALNNALIQAASTLSEQHLRVLRLLLDNGADENVPVFKETGRGPILLGFRQDRNLLWYALEKFRGAPDVKVKKVVDLLLEYGANPNVGRGSFNCPLDTAICSSWLETADLLVQRGADETELYKRREQWNLELSEVRERTGGVKMERT